jgi:RNA polymerase sigma-70 factor (ECF subfamily)
MRIDQDTMDEQALIGGLLAGGPAGFRDLVEAYGPQSMALAVNILGNRQDAEDVCQEAFLQVFRRLDRYDPARSFKTWLFTIVSRRAFDVLKKKRRFYRFVDRATLEPRATFVAGADPDPARPLPEAVLRGLTPRERTALCLWANEGFNAQDIAEVLRCSATTVRVYLFNARKKIRSLMENDHGVLQTD